MPHRLSHPGRLCSRRYRAWVRDARRISLLRSARDLMNRRFAEPLDLNRLAAQAGFSKFHFARAFKDAYGETPANDLTRRRVERAKDLLCSANLTLAPGGRSRPAAP
jgi:transcriptional regulator GlxA family with amidase domain